VFLYKTQNAMRRGTNHLRTIKRFTAISMTIMLALVIVLSTSGSAKGQESKAAPAGVLTETFKKSLVENKETLIELLERESVRLGAANRRGLIIRWCEYPDWIELHDPLSGEWHEIRASECLPGVVEAANRKGSRKTNRKERKADLSRRERRHVEPERRARRPQNGGG